MNKALLLSLALFCCGLQMQAQTMTEDEIMVTVGGSEGIDLCVRAFIEPGDEVLIPEPSYVAYAPIVSLTYGVPVPIPLKEENNFRLMP